MRIFGRVEFTSENLDSQVVRARVQGELAFLEVGGLDNCGTWEVRVLEGCRSFIVLAERLGQGRSGLWAEWRGRGPASS